MDRPTAPADRAALIRRLDAARARLSLGMGDLRGDLDVGARVQHALTGRPLRLIGVAAVAGLLFGLFRGRGSRRSKRGSRREEISAVMPRASALAMLPVLLKFLLPLVKPAIATWVAQRVARSGD